MSRSEAGASVALRVGLLVMVAFALTVAAEFQSIKRYLKIRSM
jgi:hypothetical protein